MDRGESMGWYFSAVDVSTQFIQQLLAFWHDVWRQVINHRAARTVEGIADVNGNGFQTLRRAQSVRDKLRHGCRFILRIVENTFRLITPASTRGAHRSLLPGYAVEEVKDCRNAQRACITFKQVRVILLPGCDPRHGHVIITRMSSIRRCSSRAVIFFSGCLLSGAIGDQRRGRCYVLVISLGCGESG